MSIIYDEAQARALCNAMNETYRALDQPRDQDEAECDLDHPAPPSGGWQRGPRVE